MSVELLKQPLLDASTGLAKEVGKDVSSEQNSDPKIMMELLLKKYSKITHSRYERIDGAHIHLSHSVYRDDPFVLLMGVFEFLCRNKFQTVTIYAPCRFSLYLDALFELLSSVSSVMNLGKLDLRVELVFYAKTPFPITFISGGGIMRVRLVLPKTSLCLQHSCLNEFDYSWGAKAIKCELNVCELISFLVPEGLLRRFQYLGNAKLRLMASESPSRESVYHLNRLLLNVAREANSPPFDSVYIGSSKQLSRSWMRLASGIYSRSVELSTFSTRVSNPDVIFYKLDTEYLEEVRVFGRKVTDDVSEYTYKSYGTVPDYEEDESFSSKVSKPVVKVLRKLKKVFEQVYSQ